MQNPKCSLTSVGDIEPEQTAINNLLKEYYEYLEKQATPFSFDKDYSALDLCHVLICSIMTSNELPRSKLTGYRAPLNHFRIA